MPNSGRSISARRGEAIALLIGPSSSVRGRQREVGRLGRAAFDRREAICLDRDPRPDLAVRPLHRDFRLLGRSQAEGDPTELPTGMPAANRELATLDSLADAHLHPGTDGIVV